MATQIKPDGTETEVKPQSGKYFTLEEMYKLTACYCIDIVELADGRQMIVDDNGLCVNEPEINPKATTLYWAGRNTDSPIAGTVLICSQKEVK